MNDMLAPVKPSPPGSPDRARFILALAFNLVPLAGVAFWGWSPFELIFLYWLENVVIGLRTLTMIVLSGRFHGYRGGVGIGGFFTIHYGLFCYVHGMFVMVLFGGGLGVPSVNAASAVPAVSVGLAAILVWQGALLMLQLYRGDQSTPLELMASPYPRIVALHLTILLGGFLLMAMNWPHAGIVVLAVVKTIMDALIALKGGLGHASAGRAQTPVIRPPARRRP